LTICRTNTKKKKKSIIAQLFVEQTHPQITTAILLPHQMFVPLPHPIEDRQPKTSHRIAAPWLRHSAAQHLYPAQTRSSTTNL